jgi:hypothetical protein
MNDIVIMALYLTFFWDFLTQVSAVQTGARCCRWFLKSRDSGILITFSIGAWKVLPLVIVSYVGALVEFIFAVIKRTRSRRKGYSYWRPLSGAISGTCRYPFVDVPVAVVLNCGNR